MYKTILVPLDGSERAERIFPHVEELAQKLGANSLTTLSVIGYNCGQHEPKWRNGRRATFRA